MAEQVPARRGNRRGAAIGALGGEVGGVGAFDHMAGDAIARGGQRQRHAYEAATQNDQIAVIGDGRVLSVRSAHGQPLRR
jgi:hypothetical protein